MSVHSIVPETALTAELLGTERTSHAVQVTADGLLLTVGYSVLEASEVWVTNRKGQSSEAIILAQDYDSGIALLKPMASLGLHHLATATVADLTVGDELHILASADKDHHPVKIFALEEFAGRWEYLLDTAIYTQPLFERWSGAALLTLDGRLAGIGSLALGLRSPGGKVEPGNLFIPVELVMPHLDYMKEHGQKPGRTRPWLGAMVEEHNREVYVVGIYHDAPAAKAGLQPGDIILSVDRKPVNSMASFFRTVWQYGPAGTPLPLTLSDGKDTREVVLTTTDRDSFFMKYAANLIN
ncbi:MAG TPA: S1C family serine protease [Candidatus Acidoferrum sp.]|nr:S1C family serine protease [Candidatus Acidoferrum sp.]